MSEQKSGYLLEMNGICKEFPGVKALDNVELKVKYGVVHALLGENGAGKSTLMKILMGIYEADKGTVVFNGKTLRGRRTVRESMHVGISMIHQELASFSQMTIAENIYLNREPRKGLFVDNAKMNRDTIELFKYIGMDIDPTLKMKDITTAYAQMVEIARAVSLNADLIIMDEPTSAITETEVEMLFHVIRRLKNEGRSIIYITHKMDEIFQIADDVTVLRDGHYVGSKPITELDSDQIVSMMVGRQLVQLFPPNEAVPGEVVMKVEHLSRQGEFQDVSFEVRKGEILGIAGMMGAGRSEIMSAIFGITKPDEGTVTLHGEPLPLGKPKVSIQRGMAMLTEDRKGTGLFLGLSVNDNIGMPSLRDFTTAGLLSQKKLNAACEVQIKAMSIKTPSGRAAIRGLSGGNQQKALLGRWLYCRPDILIIDEPTRGIDVGAKFEIHKILCDLAKNGTSVIMISSEMPEVLGISNRVLVVSQGRITGEFQREELTQETIMKYAAV